MDSIAYHNRTKHHFDRYARSAGYLDWANQPHPFRYYENAPVIALNPFLAATEIPYSEMFQSFAKTPQPLTIETISLFFRYAMGLSAWKEFGESRWALRVNPSSGNLHPTEAYAILPAIKDIGEHPSLVHYAPEHHSLERRADLPDDVLNQCFLSDSHGCFLVGLSSIPWREAWKYGERAFRYCQHDVGHALAALRLSTSLLGWKMKIIPEWSDDVSNMVLGLNRDDGFIETEREVADVMAVVYPGDQSEPSVQTDEDLIRQSFEGSEWFGTPNRLSREHVRWEVIDEALSATHKPATGELEAVEATNRSFSTGCVYSDNHTAHSILVQRRSAVAMEAGHSMPYIAFKNMIRRVLPDMNAPWDSLYWSPSVNLLMFIHDVEAVSPGVYMLIRNDIMRERLKQACSDDFLWTKADDALPLFALQYGDCRDLAATVSCHQDIAGDGCFSLGMIADFRESIERHGQWFYRSLFWECGMIGQLLYLEAEANGVRGTGIGCYFDDAVHQMLGFRDDAFQSLYHFTVGVPVLDDRLMTRPGYTGEPKSGSE